MAFVFPSCVVQPSSVFSQSQSSQACSQKKTSGKTIRVIESSFETCPPTSLKSSFFGDRARFVSDESSRLSAAFAGFQIQAVAEPAVIQKLGPDTWNKTWYPKDQDTAPANKQWYVIDAKDQRLGRLATEIAMILRGKKKPNYTPSADTGDYVIVINCEHIAVTGNKETQKVYRQHSGRPGGMKTEQLKDVRVRIPERIIEHAVKGMLPKGPLGRKLFTHLKVVQGPDHPFAAQKPVEYKVNTIPKPAKKAPIPTADAVEA